MHKIIVITHPSHLNEEREICRELFNSGLEKLHVRKNNWSEEKLSEWLLYFTTDELKKMIVHRYSTIFDKFDLGGLHLPYSNDCQYSKKTSQTFSSSVHNWEEARIALNYCDYILISPIFDSISKNTYSQNKDLLIIPDDLKNKKIIALGGIDENTISKVEGMGFYGAAILGYIWNNTDNAIENYKKLKKKYSYA